MTAPTATKVSSPKLLRNPEALWAVLQELAGASAEGLEAVFLDDHLELVCTNARIVRLVRLLDELLDHETAG